jgi:hypothetical protein
MLSLELAEHLRLETVDWESRRSKQPPVMREINTPLSDFAGLHSQRPQLLGNSTRCCPPWSRYHSFESSPY